MRNALFAVVTALALLPSCRTTGPAPDPKPGDVVAVRGTLTAEGVECPAMRGSDGKLYTLSRRELGPFKVGDKVCVRGTVAEMSFCMQGITINVETMSPEGDCP